MNGAPGGIPDDGSIIWGQANLLTWVDNTVSHGGNYPDCFKAMFVNFLIPEIVLETIDQFWETFKGKSVHGICVYGIGDLSWILENKSAAFFAKKFSDEFDDLVLQCIEEELHFREIQYELEEKEIWRRMKKYLNWEIFKIQSQKELKTSSINNWNSNQYLLKFLELQRSVRYC